MCIPTVPTAATRSGPSCARLSRRGLAGLSITDHDTLQGSLKAMKIIREERLDLILIPGAEVTTSEGHLLVLGVQEMPPRGTSPEETAEMAREQGGIAIVPHPYHPFRHAIGRIPDCDAVEVYNSKHLFGIANARARMGAKKRHFQWWREATRTLPPRWAWGSRRSRRRMQRRR